MILMLPGLNQSDVDLGSLLSGEEKDIGTLTPDGKHFVQVYVSKLK